MSANLNTRATDNAVYRSGGLVWHRLHSEREDICEALLKEPVPAFRTGPAPGMSQEDTVHSANWHKEHGYTLKGGWIGVGLRIGMWINDKLVSTSPVQSIRVERHTAAEPASALMSVMR